MRGGLKDHGLYCLPLGSPRLTLRNKTIRAGLLTPEFCHSTKSQRTQEESHCLWAHPGRQASLLTERRPARAASFDQTLLPLLFVRVPVLLDLHVLAVCSLIRGPFSLSFSLSLQVAQSWTILSISQNFIKVLEKDLWLLPVLC